ncbi:MAG: hypothetical protein K0S55_2018 [Clostridia bacterium]|jgi:hypothetical protein|nr:hypothetical protein [Clostridia bacterium]
MKINDEIKLISDEIIKLIDPEIIILYGKKVDISCDKLKEISLCAVISSGDKKQLEKDVYLSVFSELAFNILIYTAKDWEKFCSDSTSYAHAIREKGVVVYEKTSK